MPEAKRYPTLITHSNCSITVNPFQDGVVNISFRDGYENYFQLNLTSGELEVLVYILEGVKYE